MIHVSSTSTSPMYMYHSSTDWERKCLILTDKGMETKRLRLQKAIQNNHNTSKLSSKKHSGGQSIILDSYIPETKKQTTTKKKKHPHLQRNDMVLLPANSSASHNSQLRSSYFRLICPMPLIHFSSLQNKNLAVSSKLPVTYWLIRALLF